MIKWRLDEQTAKNDRVADWVSEVCEHLAKHLDVPCKDRVLVCSGGPYRGVDVETYYNPDTKQMTVDFYTPMRLDPQRTQEAIRYAIGMLKDSCSTHDALVNKYPDNWKEKWQEWKEGMEKLTEEEWTDAFKKFIEER